MLANNNKNTKLGIYKFKSRYKTTLTKNFTYRLQLWKHSDLSVRIHRRRSQSEQILWHLQYLQYLRRCRPVLWCQSTEKKKKMAIGDLFLESFTEQ